MDPVTVKLIALVVVLTVFGISLRRRYGNFYAAFTQWVERTTGISTASILRALGLATLAVWAVVYLLYGGAEQEGLKELFPDVLEAPAGKDRE